MQLVPCPGCHRHVHVSETVCPFCSEELELQAFGLVEMPRERLSRGAWFAFNSSSRRAAVLVAASAATSAGACAVYGDPGPYHPWHETDADNPSNVDAPSESADLSLHVPSENADSGIDARLGVDFPSNTADAGNPRPPEDAEPTIDSAMDAGD